jgi:hypothetical protein
MARSARVARAGPRKTGLADTGLADDRDEVRSTIADDPLPRRPQERQLALPSDEGAPELAEPAWPSGGEHAEEDVGAVPLADVEGTARRTGGAGAENDLAGSGAASEPRGRHHGSTHHGRSVAAGPADEDLPAVDSDPKGMPGPAHGERRMQGALGVVLLRRGRPERRHEFALLRRRRVGVRLVARLDQRPGRRRVERGVLIEDRPL